jgi:hypothetical protein
VAQNYPALSIRLSQWGSNPPVRLFNIGYWVPAEWHSFGSFPFYRPEFPELIIKYDKGCPGGNPIGQNQGQVMAEYPINQPAEGARQHQGIHGEGNILCGFTANGFENLREKGGSGKKGGQQTDGFRKMHTIFLAG